MNIAIESHSCSCFRRLYIFFFFQAEDGIRDSSVTGVQTCALPISVFTETRFSEHRIAAGRELARENGDNGNLQGAGRRTGGSAQAEPGRRPPGGPDRAWGRAQSRLLLLAGALRLLE